MFWYDATRNLYIAEEENFISLDLNKTWRDWLIRLFHWSFISSCLVYVFWDIDVDLFVSIVSSYHLLPVIIATLIVFGGYLALAARLRTLSEKKISFKISIIGTIIGQGVNNILPAKLGEAVKAIYLSRETNQSSAWFFGLVFWERFFDLNALLILGLVIVYLISSPFSMGAFTSLLIAIWAVLLLMQRWPDLARKIVKNIPFKKINSFCSELFEHLIKRLSLQTSLRVTGWTIILWLQYIFQVGLILLWAADLQISFAAVIVIFIVSGIGLNLATSPGGLGVYEAAIVVSASWFGVGHEDALASAIVLHVIQYVPSTILGLLLMSRSNISFKQVKKTHIRTK